MVAVLAAFVVGVGALGGSSVMSSPVPRVVVALLLLVAGWPVLRPARDPAHPLTRAVGAPVLRGIGSSLVVLGGYLLGMAMLTAVVAEPVTSVFLFVLLVYGCPALTLVVVAASTGMRAWAVGAGALLPMLLVLLLIAVDVTATAVSVTTLVLALVLTAVVVRSDPAAVWSSAASVAAAMSASFAFGAGSSPFGSLGTTQFGGAADPAAVDQTVGPQLVAALALLTGAFLLILAVLRRDLPTGILAATTFATPPVFLRQDQSFATWQSNTTIVVLVVPVVLAVIALVALRVHSVRRALTALVPIGADPAGGPASRPGSPQAGGPTAAAGGPGYAADGGPGGGAPQPGGPAFGGGSAAHGASHGRSGDPESTPPIGVPVQNHIPPANPDARSAAAFAVVLAAAAVVFVVMGLPVLDWHHGVHGAIALVVLAAAGALAVWLPGKPGAAAAVVALLGLGLGPPWLWLIIGGARTVAGVVESVLAIALAVVLVCRHWRPSVFAASAYLVARATAALLGALLYDPAYSTRPDDDDWVPVLIVALPLLLLAVPAALAAFGRWAAYAQAVGAVALAAGGFLPMKVLVAEFSSGAAGLSMQTSLSPLTPTDWLGAAYFLRTVSAPVLVMMIILVLVGFVLAASLAKRPNGALAAAFALLLLAVVQSALLTAVLQWSAEEAQVIGWSLGGAAIAAALVAAVTAQSAAGRYRGVRG
ncbi:hypothetical protein BLA60_16735 [Actinophytocola xinjiangensis]|uniref:Uncharacterized protein n=1 Tax=Actinophytocola xinjiangensis TaxID=485602 RepID=A0A7Z1AY44_9PSEU|nr:hypothetical protein BLA60_16735 [Actinophytocola xinjiangensis]